MTLRAWLLLTLAALGAATAARADAPLNQQFFLVLHDGLWKTDGAGLDIDFVVTCRDGKWAEDVWGTSVSYNRSYHYGQLVEAKVDGQRLRISVKTTLPTIGWWIPPGGTGEYSVELAPAVGGYEGTYTGTFRGLKRNGRATATVLPLPPTMAGFMPVAAGEHPRLLLRKKGLPSLRQKAKTPMGQAIVAALREKLAAEATEPRASNSAAGFALMYALEGNPRDAAAAAALAQVVMEKELGGSYWPELARPMVALSLAYDLCYEAWEPEQRQRVAAELARHARETTKLDGHNYRQEAWSWYQASARGAAGFAALAVMGDPAGESAPPSLLTIDAGKSFAPGKGVPVVAFQSDQTPNRWLAAGPMPVVRDSGYTPGPTTRPIDRLMASIGGGAARPEVGTEIRIGDVMRRFGLLQGCIVPLQSARGRDAIELTEATGRLEETVCAFYTVIQNDKPRVVRFRTDGAQQSVWLNGQPLRNGDYVKLSEGLLPLLVAATLMRIEPSWGKVLITPRFVETDEETARAEIDKAQAATRKAAPATDVSTIDPDSNVARAHQAAQVAVLRYLQTGLGNGGWSMEGDGEWAYALTEGVLPYLCAAKNVLGQDFAAGTGASAAPVLWTTMAIPFAGDAVVPRFARSDLRRDYSRMLWAGLPLVDAKQRPAVLWAIGRTWPKSMGIDSGLDAAIALTSSLSVGEPANPAGLVPLAAQDSQTGLCVFRNGWKDENDLAAAIYVKRTARGEQDQIPDFGSFRIWGMGCRWAERGGNVDSENILFNGHSGTATGEVTHYEAKENGSGVVSMKRSGAAGVARSFAADYSGASGAPGLFVVVDSFPAGSERIWRIHSEVPISIQGQTFTMAATPGATLKGTFVAPAKVNLAVDGQSHNVPRAIAKEPFFVVMTIQNGAAPVVTASGAGLDAKVSVGGQTVTFDGQKIVFGK